MKKAEIIERLIELEKVLKMSPEEYAEYANEKYQKDSKYKIKAEDAWYYRTGSVQSEISCILREESGN